MLCSAGSRASPTYSSGRSESAALWGSCRADGLQRIEVAAGLVFCAASNLNVEVVVHCRGDVSRPTVFGVAVEMYGRCYFF